MDRLDTAIIDVLREDGRIANVALAERVGLTPGPCLRRVQRLEADGIIVGYQALISPAAANQSFEVLLDIEITDFDVKSIETFEATMADYPQVLELHRLFGSPDYLVRVAVAEMLKRNNLTLQDFDFYEIHEAFAAQVLCTLRAWESEEYCRNRLGLSAPLGRIDPARINPNGSSLAAGHPFAATGARIVATAAKELQQRGSGRCLISIFTAGGMGVVAILER